MEPVLHLTSIFPMARQAQVKALETWYAAHGQPVVSLNHSRECALLRGQLPAWVRLVELRFARRFGGDHVPMSAFAQVARGLSHAGQRVILSLPEIPLAQPAALLSELENGAEVVALHAAGQGASDGLPVFGGLVLAQSALPALVLGDAPFGLAWWEKRAVLKAVSQGRSAATRADMLGEAGKGHARPVAPYHYPGGFGTLRSLLPEEAAPKASRASVDTFARAVSVFLRQPKPAGWAAFLGDLSASLGVTSPKDASPADMPEWPVSVMLPHEPGDDAQGGAQVVFSFVEDTSGVAAMELRLRNIVESQERRLGAALFGVSCRVLPPEGAQVSRGPDSFEVVVCPDAESWIRAALKAGTTPEDAVAAWDALADRALAHLDALAARGAAVSVQALARHPQRAVHALEDRIGHAGTRLKMEYIAPPGGDKLKAQAIRLAIGAGGGTGTREDRLVAARLAPGLVPDAPGDAPQWGEMLTQLDWVVSSKRGDGKKLTSSDDAPAAPQDDEEAAP